MAQFCIPKNVMEKVKTSIKELDPQKPIQKLASMSTKERKAFFGKSLGDQSATKLNAEFEKAIASQKIRALEGWIKKNLSEKYRTESLKKSMEGKIKNLDELDAYIDANIENFVLQKNNLVLSAKEVKKFNELGKALLQEQQKIGDNLGDIVGKYEDNLNFFKRIKELEEYSQELMPSSRFNTFIKSTGKAIMLASIKSPLLNIISNTAGGVLEAVSRRLSNVSIGGKVDSSLTKTYISNARKIFKETGIDVTRMITLEDPVAGVGRTLGEDVAVPKGKVTKAFTDFIFNKTLSAPDVFFSSYHFADSANIMATKYAKSNKTKANEIFKDAMLIEPRTAEGQVVRQMAIGDSMRATYTNDSATARLNTGIRKLLGPVGDWMMPFVKTPSNVIETGLDYAGLGGLKGIYKMQKAIRADGFTGVTREAWQEIARDVTRAGLGMTGAYLLVQTIEPEEFMGAYDPNRTGIDQLKNTTYNAIKVGDKWINVDYLGPLSVPVVSMLYAKKYGKENGMMTAYSAGMLNQFSKAPGFEPLANTVKTLIDIKPETSGETLEKSKGRLAQTLLDDLASRIIPGGMLDLAKATDDVQRDTKQNKYMVKTPLVDLNLDTVAAKLPFVRKTLTEKHDSLGRIMYEESPVLSLMFGARVRTSRDDKITDEIFRLRDAGQKPLIKDLRFMNSDKIDELKAKVGQEKFYDVALGYGQELAKRYDKAMSAPSYSKKSDEEKKKVLDDIGTELYAQTLRKNGIKYR